MVQVTRPSQTLDGGPALRDRYSEGGITTRFRLAMVLNSGGLTHN